MTRWRSIAGAVAPSVFITAWAVLGARTDGYSPVDDPISRLAAVGAPTRIPMTAALVAYAIGLGAYAGQLRDDPAMQAARPWDQDRRVAPESLPKGACIWVDHVKMNEDRAMVAQLGDDLTPENMELGLAYDYEHNLY